MTPSSDYAGHGKGNTSMSRHLSVLMRKRGRGTAAMPISQQGQILPLLPMRIAWWLALLALLAMSGCGTSPEESLTPREPFTGRLDDVWPTSVEGRLIRDQFGHGWFGVGEAAWSLVGQLSEREILTYLDDRARKGANVVLVNAPEPYFASGGTRNYSGFEPFLATPFRSGLTEEYWRTVDHAVQEAWGLGITVMLCPAYLGNSIDGADGWRDELLAVAPGDLFAYGQALGRRYSHFPNVMWLIGHDTVPDDELKDRMEALVRGLKDSGDSHLIVPGGWHDDGSFSTGSRDWRSTSIPWDVETVYDYSGSPISAAERAWQDTRLPVVYLEGKYEQEKGLIEGDQRLRLQTYGAFVGGGSLDHVWVQSHLAF